MGPFLAQLLFPTLSILLYDFRSFEVLGKMSLCLQSTPANLYLIIFFNYRSLKAKRDAYISHLNRIYRNNLDKVNPLLLSDTSISRVFLDSLTKLSCFFLTISFTCTFLRLKSRPFKVMPGLPMTLNPLLRLTVKNTARLTSSSPLEGSHLF